MADTTPPSGLPGPGPRRSPTAWPVSTSTCPSKATSPRSTGATGWLNSPPLTPAGLKGRVVLVDFWTYTCVNWLRTLPYVRAWAAKYADAGLTVVGVHTPEFEFERDVDNVTAAVARIPGRPIRSRSTTTTASGSAFANHYLAGRSTSPTSRAGSAITISARASTP